jgi:hypothetical protein
MAVSNFYENSRRYWQFCVNDTGDKLFTGVKIIAGVVDTGDKLLPVWLTLAIVSKQK